MLELFVPAMARLARIVVPGFAHHATQRGNRRSDVFKDDMDRRKYVSVFGEYRQKRGLIGVRGSRRKKTSIQMKFDSVHIPDGHVAL